MEKQLLFFKTTQNTTTHTTSTRRRRQSQAKVSFFQEQEDLSCYNCDQRQTDTVKILLTQIHYNDDEEEQDY